MNPSNLSQPLTQTLVSNMAANTSTLTTSGVDISGYKGGLLIQQLVGVVSGTNPTWDGKIQTSADNSTNWTDISGATFVEATATNDYQKIGVDVESCLRYIRYVGTIGGTNTPTFNLAVVLLGQKERV